MNHRRRKHEPPEVTSVDVFAEVDNPGGLADASPGDVEEAVKDVGMAVVKPHSAHQPKR